jgi:DNA-binding PadR family transcriptional regulator
MVTSDKDLPAPAYVVLGMVRLGAKSGYEIKQFVEQSIRFFWTISQAQIYPSLAELERTGLVVGRSEPQGRRPRRVFEITPAGESALEAAASEAAQAGNAHPLLTLRMGIAFHQSMIDACDQFAAEFGAGG